MTKTKQWFEDNDNIGIDIVKTSGKAIVAVTCTAVVLGLVGMTGHLFAGD